MKPIKFEGSNIVFAEDQDEYISLPAHTDGNKVTFCMELTDEEIQKIQRSKVIWHTVLTFGHALQPQLMEAWKPGHILHANSNAELPKQAQVIDRVRVDSDGNVYLDNMPLGAFTTSGEPGFCPGDDFSSKNYGIDVLQDIAVLAYNFYYPSNQELVIDETGVVTLSGNAIGQWVIEEGKALFYLKDPDNFQLTPKQFFANVRLGEEFEQNQLKTDKPKLH